MKKQSRILWMVTTVVLLIVGKARSENPNSESDLQLVKPLSTVVWPLEMINSDKKNSQPNQRGEGIQICLIDSGIDAKNPYLQGALLGGRSFISEKDQNDFSDDGINTMGTWLATLLVGQSPKDAKYSYSGIAPKAKIWVAKVYDSKTPANILSLAKALLYCSERSNIINISHQAYSESPVLLGLIEELRKKDIRIVGMDSTALAPASYQLIEAYMMAIDL